jgi:hypothetical protein
MNPGFELDLLIAEKVFSWENGKHFKVLSWGGDSKYICKEWDENNLPQWSPSQDIKAAWLVVEKLKDKDSRGFALMYEEGSWFVGGMVVGDKGQSELSYFVGESSSAPHAICLAALRTIENV